MSVNLLEEQIKGIINDVFSNLKEYGNIINIKDYGVKGDGVTNDTEAFKNACNELRGKSVYIPAGVYIINKIVPYTHQIALIGEDKNTVIFKSGYDTVEGATSNASEYDNMHDFYYSNITFENYVEFKYLHARNINIENCNFNNCLINGIKFNQCDNMEISNCIFNTIGEGLSDINSDGRAVIWNTGDVKGSDGNYKKGSHLVVENCEFYNVRGNSTIMTFGSSCNDVVIKNNKSYDSTYGFFQAWNYQADDGFLTLVEGNQIYRAGFGEPAQGDNHYYVTQEEGGDAASSGVGCSAIYLGGTSVKNGNNAICRNNFIKDCVENGVEGSWLEIAYNTVINTGCKVKFSSRWKEQDGYRYTPSTEGYYIFPSDSFNQYIHHNVAINIPWRGFVIMPKIEARGVYFEHNSAINCDQQGLYINCVGGRINDLSIKNNSFEDIFFHHSEPNVLMDKLVIDSNSILSKTYGVAFRKGYINISNYTKTYINNPDIGYYLMAKDENIDENIINRVSLLTATSDKINQENTDGYCSVWVQCEIRSSELSTTNILKLTTSTWPLTSNGNAILCGLYNSEADIPAEEEWIKVNLLACVKDDKTIVLDGLSDNPIKVRNIKVMLFDGHEEKINNSNTEDNQIPSVDTKNKGYIALTFDDGFAKYSGQEMMGLLNENNIPYGRAIFTNSSYQGEKNDNYYSLQDYKDMHDNYQTEIFVHAATVNNGFINGSGSSALTSGWLKTWISSTIYSYNSNENVDIIKDCMNWDIAVVPYKNNFTTESLTEEMVADLETDTNYRTLVTDAKYHNLNVPTVYLNVVNAIDSTNCYDIKSVSFNNSYCFNRILADDVTEDFISQLDNKCAFICLHDNFDNNPNSLRNILLWCETHNIGIVSNTKLVDIIVNRD